MNRKRAKEIVKLAEDLVMVGMWPNNSRGCAVTGKVAEVLVAALPEERLLSLAKALGVNTKYAARGGVRLAYGVVDFSDDCAKKSILKWQRKHRANT